MRTIDFICYIVLISFSLFQRCQTLVFISPTEDEIFHEGSQVIVQLEVTSANSYAYVSQNCGSEPQLVRQLDESNRFSATFQLPETYVGECTYFADDFFTSETAEARIFVQNFEGLTIVSPTPSSQLIIGTPFNAFITTTDPDVRLPISLIFTGNPAQRISGTTNVQQWVTLDSSYLGSNSLSIASGPLTFPVSIPIILKYGFEFIVAPNFIVKGVPFNLLLQTSDFIVNPAPSAIPLFLTCGNTLVYSWTGVSLNQLTRLAPIPNDSNTDQLNCLLSTEANSQFFYQILRSVSLVSSPFRAQLRPITPEQQAAFAVSIAIPPGELIASG